MHLPELFRALGRELRAQVESVSGGHHPAEKGARREAAFRGFLRHVLPDDCLVASDSVQPQRVLGTLHELEADTPAAVVLRRPHLPDLRAYLGVLDLSEPIFL